MAAGLTHTISGALDSRPEDHLGRPRPARTTTVLRLHHPHRLSNAPKAQARCSNTTPTHQNCVCAAQRPYSGDRVPIICGSPARRTVASLTPTAAAAHPDIGDHFLAQSRGPLGPRLPHPNAATPTSVTAPYQRRSVSVVTPKPSASRMARAPLIRTSCTAARRRPKSSPASHAKTRSPRTNTRPRPRPPPERRPERRPVLSRSRLRAPESGAVVPS
jgi:hypothetical protein